MCMGPTAVAKKCEEVGRIARSVLLDRNFPVGSLRPITHHLPPRITTCSCRFLIFVAVHAMHLRYWCLICFHQPLSPKIPVSTFCLVATGPVTSPFPSCLRNIPFPHSRVVIRNFSQYQTAIELDRHRNGLLSADFKRVPRSFARGRYFVIP